MAKQGTQPTVKDVAREAGVALGTVSKVINGLPVGESYRIRVEEAIERLGYRVNYYAKGLKSNHTYTIAVLLPNLINPYFALLAAHLNRAIAEKGHQMMIFCTDYDPKLEQQLVDIAEQKRVDGIICMSYNPSIHFSDDIPVVSIDRYFGGDIACVSSDNFGGGKLAAEQLYALGCRKLAILHEGSPLNNEPRKRVDGFIEGCRRLELPYLMRSVTDGTPANFMEFLREHCGEGRGEIDGLFCATDNLACRASRMLRELGLRVPEDVQIIGFDGLRLFGDRDYYCSTIVQPADLIAATAVDLVLQEPDTAHPTLVCLPVHFAPGRTTRS